MHLFLVASFAPIGGHCDSRPILLGSGDLGDSANFNRTRTRPRGCGVADPRDLVTGPTWDLRESRTIPNVEIASLKV